MTETYSMCPNFTGSIAQTGRADITSTNQSADVMDFGDHKRIKGHSSTPQKCPLVPSSLVDHQGGPLNPIDSSFAPLISYTPRIIHCRTSQYQLFIITQSPELWVLHLGGTRSPPPTQPISRCDQARVVYTWNYVSCNMDLSGT